VRLDPHSEIQLNRFSCLVGVPKSIGVQLKTRQASRMLEHSFIGSRETVRNGLQSFVAQTKADELMVGSLYDHDARVRSYEIVAGLNH